MSNAQAQAPVRAWYLERSAQAQRQVAVAELVSAGLGATPKTLPPILFYDQRGSELFDEICRLEEYYVTRTERQILEERASQIATACGPVITVVELGSGSSEKSEIVLELLRHAGRNVRYVPIDISESALRSAAGRLSEAFGEVELRVVVTDYDDGLRRLARHVRGQCLLIFLGGNLGNLEPQEQMDFLRRARFAAGPSALLLLGLDLVKDVAVLERAYDDSLGVTAEFNRNVLRRINRELNADFDLEAFAHEARWNAAAQRIEMHLRSLRQQTVTIAATDHIVEFAAGETIHTENSYKFTPAGIDRLAKKVGWKPLERWLDPQNLFSLNLLLAPKAAGDKP